MAKLRMAHASMHGTRKPPWPILIQSGSGNIGATEHPEQILSKIKEETQKYCSSKYPNINTSSNDTFLPGRKEPTTDKTDLLEKTINKDSSKIKSTNINYVESMDDDEDIFPNPDTKIEYTENIQNQTGKNHKL